MSDPELLKLTASEPLTLDQEYEMQETWRNDEDSMIFNHSNQEHKLYRLLIWFILFQNAHFWFSIKTSMNKHKMR